MPKLTGTNFSYELGEDGRVLSYKNILSGHEYVSEPFRIWKLIYKDTDENSYCHEELCATSVGQKFSCTENDGVFEITYDSIIGENRTLGFCLTLRFETRENGLAVIASAENNDPKAELVELQLMPVSGVGSLSGNPGDDFIAWPDDLGIRIRDPYHAMLCYYSGFGKYSRHDEKHTDLDGLYGHISMQWYDLHNEDEGLYCGSHDTTYEAVGLHVERDVSKNLISMGFTKYPMLAFGEKWNSDPIVFYPHLGDWHSGSKFYREFMDKEAGFVPPEHPKWASDMKGWLRLIFKQQHGEINWNFSDIPALYDELEAAGFSTLYLLGWEKGGFARRWPDFYVDDVMGGAEKLREGIEYVHRKGGRVMMFLSYCLVDLDSDFVKYENGVDTLIKTVWGSNIPFAECYCGEGTYRKVANPEMPMYRACPGSDRWQEKLKWAARQCLDLGADGVLYDLGGLTPYFCYAENHDHKKPSHSHSSNRRRYKELRETVRNYGDDKIIAMENNVDIYGESMDVSHGWGTPPDYRFLNPNSYKDPNAKKGDSRLYEMYRYTFPELIATNRDCGHDEEDNFRAKASNSFIYSLRFDMTIHRCCGTFKDIPNYTEYLKYLNSVYEQYKEYLLEGKFVDTDGFTASNPAIVVKGYANRDGKLGFALWNYSDIEQTTVIKVDDGREITATLPPFTAGAAD